MAKNVHTLEPIPAPAPVPATTRVAVADAGDPNDPLGRVVAWVRTLSQRVIAMKRNLWQRDRVSPGCTRGSIPPPPL